MGKRQYRAIVSPDIEPTVTNKEIIEEFKKGPIQRIRIFYFLEYNRANIPIKKVIPCLEHLAERGDAAIERFILFAEKYFLYQYSDEVEKQLALEFGIETAKSMFEKMYDELQENNEKSITRIK